LRVHEVRPAPPLDRVVQCLWTLELDAAGAWGPPERILPDGIVEVVFHHAEPFRMRFDGEAFARQERAFTVSQTHRALELVPAPAGRGGFTSARLLPWGFRQVAGVPLDELHDAAAPAQAVWGDGPVRELLEALAEAPGPRARLALVEAFLRRQLARHRRDASLERVVRAIRRRRGRVGVRALADELGIGERRLQRLCRDGLGVSPRHYARLTRFLHTADILEAGGWRTLADVAQRCGFADQAHLSREFGAFAGLTPTAFLAAEHVAWLETD